MNLDLESVHGRPSATMSHGANVTAFGGGAYAFPCGTGVQYGNINSASSAKDFWVPQSGVHQVTHNTLNPKGNILVVAERRLTVNLLIFGAAERKLHQKIQDVCKVTIRDMCFSRCGGFFAVLAAGPTFHVTVFSVDPQTYRFNKIANSANPGGAANAPTTQTAGGDQQHQGNFRAFTSISFNPRDSMDMCTTGGGHAAFWRLNRNASTGQWGITMHEAKVTQPNVRLTTHAWTTGGVPNFVTPALAPASSPLGSPQTTTQYGSFAGATTLAQGTASGAFASSGGVTSHTLASHLPAGLVFVGTANGEIFEFDVSTRVGNLVLDLSPQTQHQQHQLLGSLDGGEAPKSGSPQPVADPEDVVFSINDASKADTSGLVKGGSTQEEHSAQGHAITTITISKHCVLVGTEDGTLRICTHDLAVIKTVKLPIMYNPIPRQLQGRGPQRNLDVGAGLRSMTLTPEWNSAFACSGDGTIFYLSIPGLEEPVMNEVPNVKVTQVSTSVASARHVVAGCVHLPNTLAGLEGSGTCVATISTEGLFRVYNYGTNTEICRKYLPGSGPTVEPTCMDIGSGDTSKNMISIGYSNGVVQVVQIDGQESSVNGAQKSPVKATVTFSELMTHSVGPNHPVLGEGIVGVKFDPTGQFCLAITQQCSICFFSVDKLQMDVKSIVTVQKAASTLDSPLPPTITDVAWFPQGEFSVLVSLANSEVMMLTVPNERDLDSYKTSLAETQHSAVSGDVAVAAAGFGTTTALSAVGGASTTIAPQPTTTTATTAAPNVVKAGETPYHIPADRVTTNTWRLDLPAHKVTVGALSDDSFKLLVLGADRETKVYNISRTLQIDRKDRETKTIKCEESHLDHDKKGTCMALTKGGRVMVTGGGDGRLVVRDVSASLVQNGGSSSPTASSQPAIANRHVSMDNGVSHICVSADTNRLISCGFDGVMTVNTIGKQQSFPRGSFLSEAVVEGAPATANPEVMYFSEKSDAIRLELELVQHEDARQQVKDTLSKLSEELALIRRENDGYELEDERVKLTDFLVPAEQDRFNGACQGAVETMREENRWDNLTRDYIIAKLKKECVDTMEAPLSMVRGMLVGPEAAAALAANTKQKKKAEVDAQAALTPTADQLVYNMPVRKMEGNELLLMRKLKFLRVVEQKDREIRRVQDLADVRASPDAITPGVDASSPASPATGATASDAPAGDEESKGEKETAEVPTLAQPGRRLEDEACDPVDPYLYHPWLVFTKSRATLQIRLLEGRILNLKAQFNVQFQELKAKKTEEIEKIEERNNKAKILIKELDEKHILFEPKLSKEENPMDMLTVKDDEVPADKTTDPTEKKRLEQLEIERIRWIERHGDDGSSDRALKVWMDGRLDKEIKILEVRVDAPDFTNENSDKFVPLEERSEDQVKAFREFEKKLAKKKEEVETRRKLLQGELSQIKTDNLTTATQFDAKVRTLFEWRLHLVRQCFEVELQQIKLVQGVVQQGHRVKLHKKVEEQKIKLADKLVFANKTTTQQTMVLEHKQEDLLNLQNDEKSKEKHMRQLHPFADYEDQSEILYKAFMKKKPKKGQGGGKATQSDRRTEEKKTKIRGEVQHDAQNHPDPFGFIEKDDEMKRRIAQMEENVPLQTIARPPECPDLLWDAFQRFRQDRVDAERDMKRMIEEVDRAAREEDVLAEEEGHCRAQAEEAIREVAKFQKDAVRATYDVDELHVFRQGLVEVEQAAVVTDYVNAILIPSTHIERLNELVRSSGSEQVGIMRDIGDKRKELRMIEWEIEHLEYLSGSLEMEHSNLHKLRATKQMQAFINGGGEDFNEKERSKLYQKIDHVRSSMALKIEDRKHQMMTLRRTNKEKELENRLLHEQVGAAKEIVDERVSIHDLQSSELDKERTSKLMRDMRVTRKLEDVAKAQQEEMVQLKREIDKLRERTFPSFAVVSKRVVGNPDEM